MPLKGWNFLTHKIKFLLLILLVFSQTPQANALSAGEKLRMLPVQADGRIKPFDSFAREMLEIVYGKQKYEGHDAYEIILTWMLAPQVWSTKELFEIRNFEVLDKLGLDRSKRYYKGEDIFSSAKFSDLRSELSVRRESKEKLTPYFQALQRLENQFFVFTEIATGRMIRLMPPKEGTQWISLPELEGMTQSKFLEITKVFISLLTAKSEGKMPEQIQAQKNELDQLVTEFNEMAKANNPTLYPEENKIEFEVHYNLFHPFRWAYILYILGSLLVLFSWITTRVSSPITSRDKIMFTAWVILVGGFLLHTYGFGIRSFLMGRPPVSNMYETVVWVSWGSLVFAAILEKIYKFKFTLLAGGIIAAFGMVVADSAPVVLDPSLQPLEPVLRSNYWLTVHVMTITISYAAFFLAFALGDIGLIYYLRGETKHSQKIKSIVLAIYRAKQIGVVFLAPGIILGGIWADYSWGRFWGWDPKETWALIVLLGYIAILHGRLVGWIKDFGMVVSGVLTFSLVIMAWYGVNFVLGAGLHSYGFGAGGVEYVAGFVGLHLVFTLYVTLLRRGRSSSANV